MEYNNKLLWNVAHWVTKTRHMAYNIQSKYFISTSLIFLYDFYIDFGAIANFTKSY